MKNLILLLFIPSLLLASCELFWDEPRQGDVYYIVVGLDYKNDAARKDLQGTLNDAKELFQTFTLLSEATERTSYGYLMMQEGESLSGTGTFTINGVNISNYPSVANITKVLQNLAHVTKEEDLIIFTYSGHGYVTTGDLALATTTGNTTTSDALPPAELLALMNAIPGKKLLLIDSCYSGNFVKESTSSTSTVHDAAIDDYFAKYFAENEYVRPNLFAISASADTDSYEGSFDDIDHTHGIFTYTLLAALGWDHLHGTELSTVTLSSPPAVINGKLSIDGIYQYIKHHQSLPYTFSLTTAFYNIQHPMTNGGALDMVLFTY